MISRRATAANYVVLSLFSVFAVVPLVYVVATALSPAGQAGPSLRLPSRVDLSNLTDAWTAGHFGQYVTSSVIVTTSVVVVASVLSVLAGYAFAVLRLPARGPLFAVFMVGLLVPLEGYVVPLYFTLRSYGLLDTYAALILPQVAQSLGFGAYWMRNAFASVPTSLIEAARLDGAGDARVLWSVLVPTVRPAVLSMVMLLALWTWNDFLLSLVVITGESHRTAPLALAFFQGRYSVQYAQLSAAALIVAAPVVVLYIALNKHFVRGMLGGAVRG